MEIEAVTSVHTENEQLDTFLSKTAGLQLGQKPARVADQVWWILSRNSELQKYMSVSLCSTRTAAMSLLLLVLKPIVVMFG